MVGFALEPKVSMNSVHPSETLLALLTAAGLTEAEAIG